MQAIEKLGSYPKLSAADGTTVVQLDLHTHGLLRAWMAVDGNDPVQRFGHFRAQFLATLPDQPVTSKVVVVRQHLIDAIGRQDPQAATPDGLLAMATSRAKALGMPPGDVRAPNTRSVAPVIETGKDGDKTGSPNKARPRAGKND